MSSTLDVSRESDVITGTKVNEEESVLVPGDPERAHMAECDHIGGIRYPPVLIDSIVSFEYFRWTICCFVSLIYSLHAKKLKLVFVGHGLSPHETLSFCVEHGTLNCFLWQATHHLLTTEVLFDPETAGM